MPTLSRAPVNPFAMMLDPQSVIDAVERSGCLDHLKRRVYRPLDKPLIPKRPSAELAAFDQSIDEDLDAGDYDAAELADTFDALDNDLDSRS